ncbi:hypothetical protein [Paracoccus mutanolyticus]|nr:hypothetical protein [Paracoccus mutanolyticus]
MEVLSPSGDVAERQRDLLVQSTWLMLLIIMPCKAQPARSKARSA